MSKERLVIKGALKVFYLKEIIEDLQKTECLEDLIANAQVEEDSIDVKFNDVKAQSINLKILSKKLLNYLAEARAELWIEKNQKIQNGNNQN